MVLSSLLLASLKSEVKTSLYELTPFLGLTLINLFGCKSLIIKQFHYAIVCSRNRRKFKLKAITVFATVSKSLKGWVLSVNSDILNWYFLGTNSGSLISFIYIQVPTHEPTIVSASQVTIAVLLHPILQLCKVGSLGTQVP